MKFLDVNFFVTKVLSNFNQKLNFEILNCVHITGGMFSYLFVAALRPFLILTGILGPKIKISALRRFWKLNGKKMLIALKNSKRKNNYCDLQEFEQFGLIKLSKTE